jgi:hypothetical protein
MGRGATRVELLKEAIDKRRVARHARELAEEISSNEARKGLLNYARELENLALSFEARAAMLPEGSKISEGVR